jgi:16S rRNA (cytidine1402-2'-O)-methyltransferase
VLKNLKNGSLYLIPTTLGETNPLEVLPFSIKKIIDRIDHYIVENEKSARGFIKSVLPGKSQPKLIISTLNKFTDPEEIPELLEPCFEGFDVGVLSEAGCPGVADPGAEVVKLAHEKNIQVKPLVGPSSILLALMASGLNGQQFAFNGYLPIDKDKRRKEIKRLEKLSSDFNQTQLFIETPYRNDAMLIDLVSYLSPDTKICVACDLTLPTEMIKTQTAVSWKKTKVDLHKRPTLFLFLKEV